MRFTFGLLQPLPDGKTAIDQRADDKRDFVRDSHVPRVSLGAPRDFVLYDRVTAIYDAALERHGSAPPLLTLEEGHEMRDLILEMLHLVDEAEREVRRRR